MNRYQKELLARLLIVPIGVIAMIVLIKVGLLKEAILTIGIMICVALAVFMFCSFFRSIYLMIKTDWAMRKIIETKEDYVLYRAYSKYSNGRDRMWGYDLFIHELNPTDEQKKKLDEFKKIDDEINGGDFLNENC